MRLDLFLATIYLGDRACKAVMIDGWNERVSITVDEISRIRSASGNWDNYNDENVTDGALVFTGVQSVSLTPPGPLPSDQIEIESVEPIDAQAHHFRVKFHIFGVLPESQELRSMRLELVAESVHIEDPAKPGAKVTE